MVSDNKIMDYSRFLSKASKKIEFPILREIGHLGLSAKPETVNVGGGMPNPDLFPFEEATFKVSDGTEINIGPKLMKKALQYGKTLGYDPLREQLKSLTIRFHSPPCWDSSTLQVTAGAQDGLCFAFKSLLNEGDYVIIPEPTYPTIMNHLQPYAVRFVPVGGDDDGITPDALRAALSIWDPKESRDKYDGVPKVIYINPNGGNPSGGSLSKERKEEIYNIACEYNLIILEDDPYYFLQFKDFKDFAPSFLNLDVEGRVIRFDSFSKIVSAGIRIGYATGPTALISKMDCFTASSLIHVANLPQMLVSELLANWGEDHFLQHTVSVRDFYRQKRDIMLAAAKKYLTGLCTWAVPAGGMFLWIKVLGIQSTWDMIMQRGMKRNILIVPGAACFTDQSANSPYLRAAFSVASDDHIEKGMMYLAELIREELQLENGHTH